MRSSQTRLFLLIFSTGTTLSYDHITFCTAIVHSCSNLHNKAKCWIIVVIIYDCTVAASMPKWISINGLDGAITSRLQWSNQVSQSNQMPNLCNYYSFLVTCDMLTCLHFIDKIEMEWAITIRQYTSNNHQTIYHICNGQWLMPADSRRRWSGDCSVALFCLLLAIRLLVALTMIAIALLGALMIHKHPAPLLEISVLSPTWYWEDFDWLCIRCILCLLVFHKVANSMFIKQFQSVKISLPTLSCNSPGMVQRCRGERIIRYSNTWGQILVFICVFGWLFET